MVAKAARDRFAIVGTDQDAVHPGSLPDVRLHAHELLSFDFYGCQFIPALDVDLGDDDLCGGAVKMRVGLDTGTPGGPTLPGS